MQLQTEEQEALIISDCSLGNISFYPSAWSSGCLHHPSPRARRVSRHKHQSWSMMRRATTRSDTSEPHIQRRPTSSGVSNDVGAVSLSRARVCPGIVIRRWLLILNTTMLAHRPAFTPAPHTKTAQYSFAKSLHKTYCCLIICHARQHQSEAILLRKSAQHQILGSKNPQL